MLVTPTLSHIHGRIAELGIRQADLAAHLGIHETLLNAYLRGRRRMPSGMEARIRAALDDLEEEQRVAAEAVRKLRAERAAQEVRGQELQEQE